MSWPAVAWTDLENYAAVWVRRDQTGRAMALISDACGAQMSVSDLGESILVRDPDMPFEDDAMLICTEDAPDDGAVYVEFDAIEIDTYTLENF